MTKLLLAITAALTAGACNTSSDGANGNVRFTPTNCGRITCDFDDSIGVGGKVDLNIDGIEGISTAGADVVSDSPDLLTVTPVADGPGGPTWELQALGAGVARLTVLDSSDAELDFLEVPIQELSSLGSENVIGDAVGPSDDANYDEIWTVNADQPVSFQVIPMIGNEAPTMGRYEYTATVDQSIEDTLIDDNLSKGYLYFTPTAGEHLATFENDFGQAIDILVVTQ